MKSFSTPKDHLKGLHHLGLAPKNKQQAEYFFCNVLGMTVSGKETVEDQGVLTTSLNISETSHTELELLEASHSESTIQKFLDKKGGGIHHLSFEVENLSELISKLIDLGIKMINQTPKPGSGHTNIAFVHPHSTGGILVELVEKRKKNIKS